MDALAPKGPAPGEVWLVGAGPGGLDLLTVGALLAIRGADCLIHDALVADDILAEAPPEAEHIYAGKRGGKPSADQADILDTLIDRARAGRRVIRLKGGDPFIFGRGGEETQALHEAGVPVRILPGLTAGTVAASLSGFPLTHRDVNASVGFITGHRADNAEGDGVDWAAAARAFPVLVIYMAVRRLGAICERLRAAGRAPETPVACVQWAGTEHQRTVYTDLARAPSEATAAGLGAPAVVIVGEVVDLAPEALAERALHPAGDPLPGSTYLEAGGP